MAVDFENMRAWYVVQTYSGMEYAAKRNLDRRIVSMNMEDYIFQVLIPEEKRYEKKKIAGFYELEIDINMVKHLSDIVKGTNALIVLTSRW